MKTFRTLCLVLCTLAIIKVTTRAADVVLRWGMFYSAPSGAVAFPTQFSGLRTFYNALVRELCLVAVADAPGGMGGVLKLDKNGTTLAAYLVDTTDPNASSVRVNTAAGVKALRLKT